MITCATAPRPSSPLWTRTQGDWPVPPPPPRGAQVPDAIESEVPAGLDVHLIAATLRNWFAKRPRFHIHFTPTSASWLNLVERWFGLLTEKQLRRGVHQSSGELEAAIYRYLDVTNEDPKPFVWTKTADQILASVARFCRRTLDTGH